MNLVTPQNTRKRNKAGFIIAILEGAGEMNYWHTPTRGAYRGTQRAGRGEEEEMREAL